MDPQCRSCPPLLMISRPTLTDCLLCVCACVCVCVCVCVCACVQSDESHIPQYRIVHQGNDAVGAGAQEDHHYPFAGEDNPVQMLGVVDVATGAVAWMDIDAPFGAGQQLAYFTLIDPN